MVRVPFGVVVPSAAQRKSIRPASLRTTVPARLQSAMEGPDQHTVRCVEFRLTADHRDFCLASMRLSRVSVPRNWYGCSGCGCAHQTRPKQNRVMSAEVRAIGSVIGCASGGYYD